ncbi:MAG: thioredoxin family protein [Saprospiraceae bacterium]|nr:thioredoxin family protein [Saprospiraceae bacterium]
MFGLFLLQGYTSFAQLKTYQFEQIDSLQKVAKRNVVVFIHTDWCKYCQTMQNTTFKNDDSIKMLNEKYYLVDLNAEERQNIIFNGFTFRYKPTGTNTGIHELAEQLGMFDKKISYPSLCFLNADNEIIFQYPEYITSNVLIKILKQLNP